MLKGFSPPYTPNGQSSLLSPPPWHYAGQVLSLAYDVDIQVAQSYVPENLGTATGRACGHVCEWQSTTDGWELADPVYAQYKEFFLLVEVETKSGERLNFCPLIWVDQDIAMARGLLQGWPKKLGQVWMTRSYALEHRAAASPRAGTVIGASVASKDRRLVEVKATLGDKEGRPLGLLAHPVVNLAGLPSVVGKPDRGSQRLLRAAVGDVVLGPMTSGTAELRYFDSPHDEIAPLAPRGAVEASLGMVAITINGAVEVKE
ncbi:acetoacetate decarboxylase [Trinickia violacea]|uniref:Acetoacetate decarboxylase n=1 Tax=Trinickia violacea TaxID=2571746 RepID=A0A4P8J432_9BURK|nr:acetoacetate decarboxylase family protein [Trinickia violacea]QCP54724.1 acetoacetate decarboxylase [Trinickia violacea]